MSAMRLQDELRFNAGDTILLENMNNKPLLHTRIHFLERNEAVTLTKTADSVWALIIKFEHSKQIRICKMFTFDSFPKIKGCTKDTNRNTNARDTFNIVQLHVTIELITRFPNASWCKITGA
jgi:hypothetical protein